MGTKKNKPKVILAFFVILFGIVSALLLSAERDQITSFEISLPIEQLRTAGEPRSDLEPTGGGSGQGTTTECFLGIFCPTQPTETTMETTTEIIDGETITTTTETKTTESDTEITTMVIITTTSPTETTSETITTTMPKEVSLFCAIRQETDVVDANGQVIATAKGGFLLSNPIAKMTFIDTNTKKEIEEGGFLSMLLIKCQSSTSQQLSAETASPSSGVTPQGTFGIVPSVDIPITITKSDLIVKVYSVDRTNSKLIETYNGELNTKELRLTDSREHVFGTHDIRSERVLIYVDGGTYSSWQHFAVEGNINLHLTNEPDEKYTITLVTKENFSGGNLVSVENSVLNYRQINIDKQTTVEEPRKSPSGCKDNEVFLNGFCVIKSTGGNNNQVNTGTDFTSKFLLCLETQGLTCMFHQDFIFIPIGILGSFVVIGAIAMKANKQPDIYGFANQGGF